MKSIQYPDFNRINTPLLCSSLSMDCLDKIFEIFRKQSAKIGLAWSKPDLFILMHPDAWNGGKDNIINNYPVIFDSNIKRLEDIYFLVTRVSDNLVMWLQKVKIRQLT